MGDESLAVALWSSNTCHEIELDGWVAVGLTSKLMEISKGIQESSNDPFLCTNDSVWHFIGRINSSNVHTWAYLCVMNLLTCKNA